MEKVLYLHLFIITDFKKSVHTTQSRPRSAAVQPTCQLINFHMNQAQSI